jgi:hypothetical protein
MRRRKKKEGVNLVARNTQNGCGDWKLNTI